MDVYKIYYVRGSCYGEPRVIAARGQGVVGWIERFGNSSESIEWKYEGDLLLLGTTHPTREGIGGCIWLNNNYYFGQWKHNNMNGYGT